MKPLVLACLLAVCSAISARASIVCVAPTGTTAGSITITAPITFTINSAGFLGEFVLDEWVTSDGTNTTAFPNLNLAYSINGTAGYGPFSLRDNFAGTNNAVTPNDGLFYLNSTPFVQSGDIVILATGTYTLSAVSGFNPLATQTFNGNIFAGGSAYERLSPSVSAIGNVPEPSTWAVVAAGAGLLGCVTLLRRRAVAPV